jgi:cytochrome P450
MRFAKEPDAFFRDLWQAQGDPFFAKFPTLGEIVCSATPEAAQELFALASETVSPSPGNPLEHVVGPTSLMLQKGAAHKRQRKLIGPAFTGERLRAYGDIFRTATEAAIADLPLPGEFHAHKLTSAIALDIILRAIFGVSESRRRVFTEAIGDLTASTNFVVFLIPALRKDLWGMGPWHRFCRARDRLDALLLEQVKERRGADHGHEDVLSTLIGARDEDGQQFSDEELLDQLRTLLIAGHETTAITAAWALYYAHEIPAVGAKIREELGAMPDAGQLASAKYLQATCSEALRLHPPVPFVLRTATKPFTFCGREVPVGSTAGVALGLLHENETLWPDPFRFSPERFLARKYAPHEFAPFGGGLRRCIGAAFGELELKIILGTLMTRMKCELLTRQTPSRRMVGITMAPGRPILFKLLERSV